MILKNSSACKARLSLSYPIKQGEKFLSSSPPANSAKEQEAVSTASEMLAVQYQGSWNFIPSNNEVPGSYWAWGQIFHSCTPNTKTTFILSLPWYFRCLKQNSPLSHAHWFSSLLLFALLLWAELVGFPLEWSRQNSRAEMFSVIP